MRLVERAQEALQTLPKVDFMKYLEREEKANVISADALTTEGKRQMLLGKEAEVGLTMPWAKARDKVLIKRGKLVVWCGWTHHGKSQMTKQVMVEALNQGEKVCIASMEEEIIEVWKEMGYLAMASRYPSPRDIDAWCQFFSPKLWFYDQQGRVGQDKIRAVIRYAAEELKVTQFVVDSLMMIQLPRDDYDQQAKFVADLKTVAADTGCTVHLVAHMRKSDSRGGEDQPGGVHDISGGHEISSVADSIFVVWRDKKKTNPDQYPAILKVEKQRGSVNWTGTLGLGYDNASRQYTEGGPTRYCGLNERPI